jgi:hypothetical protein
LNTIYVDYIERASVGNTECLIVGANLARAYVTKTATLFGVSRTVSKIMSAYTNRGKTTSAKRNSGRKSTVTERDRRTRRSIVSKNHGTIAAQVTGQQN